MHLIQVFTGDVSLNLQVIQLRAHVFEVIFPEPYNSLYGTQIFTYENNQTQYDPPADERWLMLIVIEAVVSQLIKKKIIKTWL
jgi:hypothetical protein